MSKTDPMPSPWNGKEKAIKNVSCENCGREAVTTKPRLLAGEYTAVDLCSICNDAYDMGFEIAVLEATGLEAQS